MDETPKLSDTIAALRDGAITALDVTNACLERIEKVDADIQAWTFLDPELARTQAKALDAARADGRAMGPLHGIPIGVKDIFDTGDMPTEDGTVLHSGRKPIHDCIAVSLSARGRRGDHGQDGDHRACAVQPRQDSQSA